MRESLSGSWCAIKEVNFVKLLIIQERIRRNGIARNYSTATSPIILKRIARSDETEKNLESRAVNLPLIGQKLQKHSIA